MSLYAYLQSIELSRQDVGFEELIMAAVKRADDINLHKLERVFPETVAEVRARYNAPGGRLEGE